MADDGTVAFATPQPLVGADQNTVPAGGDLSAASDIYEWRDGRPLLVTDGLTSWPSSGLLAPHVRAISPSGRDLFFSAPAQYTADAVDSVTRLYDARIGGGIDFPIPPRPCPLEVCQGTPKGAPEEQPPGTSDFRGLSNAESAPRSCHVGKVRRKGRCVSRSPHRKHRNRAPHRAANHHRRTNR